jgi:hypothetical protein
MILLAIDQSNSFMVKSAVLKSSSFPILGMKFSTVFLSELDSETLGALGEIKDINEAVELAIDPVTSPAGINLLLILLIYLKLPTN